MSPDSTGLFRSTATLILTLSRTFWSKSSAGTVSFGLGRLNGRDDWTDKRTDLARGVRVLFQSFNGCLDGTAPLVPEHHEERNAELKHTKLHPTDLRVVRYCRPDAADEQVTKATVEDQLWRHT